MKERYIGTKIVEAEPAQRGGVDGIEDGYKVVYEGGYESWSPKEVFEAAYRRADGLNFGLALEAAKLGHRIARLGWNGKGMYVFLAHGIDFNTNADLSELEDQDVEVLDCLVMRTATGSFCPGWLASQTDMLADDWRIVE